MTEFNDEESDIVFPDNDEESDIVFPDVVREHVLKRYRERLERQVTRGVDNNGGKSDDSL